MGIYGAVIGTLTAEIIGLIFQMILCRKFLDIKCLILVTLPYLFFGIIMFLIINLIKHFMNDNWFDLILQVVIGGLVYSLLSGFYLLLFSSIKNDVKNLLHFNKNRNN